MKSNYTYFIIGFIEEYVRLLLYVFFFDGQLYKSRPNVRIVADLEEISAVVTDFIPQGHIYKYGLL